MRSVSLLALIIILGIGSIVLLATVYPSPFQPLVETSSITKTINEEQSTLSETNTSTITENNLTQTITVSKEDVVIEELVTEEVTSKEDVVIEELVTEEEIKNIDRSPFGTVHVNCLEGNNKLTSPPLSLESSYTIEPMGRMSGLSGHLTPTDHLYLYVDIVNDEMHDVLAVASGYIIQIDRWFDQEGIGEYRMVFEHSCTLFSYYIHIQEIHPDILKESGKLSPGSSSFKRIQVDSGQAIGRVGKLKSYQHIFNQSNLDFAVIDTEITLPGFIIPSHYTPEPWKVHTVDPFDYYDEPLRSQLLKRNYRDADPKGGKIDFDIDGKLVGNWFLDGTDDYSAKGVIGKSKAEWNNIYGRDMGECTTEYWDIQEGLIGNVPCNYWAGHLTFAYDHIIPDQIRISMGIFWDAEDERSPPWGIKNNSPDPKSINPESGLIIYDLINVEPVMYPELFTSGSLMINDYYSDESTKTIGILLVQMIDNQTITVEVFFGKSSEEITGFSEEARIYRR